MPRKKTHPVQQGTLAPDTPACGHSAGMFVVIWSAAKTHHLGVSNRLASASSSPATNELETLGAVSGENRFGLWEKSVSGLPHAR